MQHLLQQAKNKEIQTKLEQIVADNPYDEKKLITLANYYLAHNNNIQAIQTYQQAILIKADNAKLFAAIAIAYLHINHYAMAK